MVSNITGGNKSYEKRYLTTRELAFRYSMSTRQVQKMTRSRIFPCVKPGKKLVRYDIIKCDAALERFERQASENFNQKKMKQINKCFPSRPYGSIEGENN